MDNEEAIGGRILKVFFGAFFVLFVVGFAAGLAVRKDEVKATVLRSISFEYRDAQPYFALRCDRKVVLLYDLTNRAIIKNPALLAQATSTGALFTLSSHRSALVAFVGGTTGAITVQSLAKTPKGSGRIRTILATVFGAASGYLAGYWIATKSADSCSSDSAISMTSEESFWKMASREIIAIKFYELGASDDRFSDSLTPEHSSQLTLQDDPLYRCESHFSQALRTTVERVVKANSEPTVDDYAIVTHLERLRIRLALNSQYLALKEQTKGLYRLTDADLERVRRGKLDIISEKLAIQKSSQAFKEFCVTLNSINFLG